jgi:rod shape determining protein RodA
MINTNHIKNIDWMLIVLLLLNSLLGVIVIESSSHHLSGNYAVRQIVWIFTGLLILVLILSVDYNYLVDFAPYFYAGALGLLFLILVFGQVTAGTRSWIKLPFFQIQPSELTKIIVILMLAYLFKEYQRPVLSFNMGLISSGVIGLPVILIAMQPDLGTALTYLPLLLGAVVLAGVNRKLILVFLILALIIAAVGWSYFLKDYQKDRIRTLLDPDKDPLGTGYHIIQSRIAIGSGGLFGKGYKKGTQSQLRFLPARHTDFIISVIGEEFGFMGITVVIFFYYLLISRIFRSVSESRNRAGMYIIFIVGVMLCCQFLINVCMAVGLLPVAGIPLPFYSYGGSSLWTNFIAAGLVLNIKMRRFANV